MLVLAYRYLTSQPAPIFGVRSCMVSAWGNGASDREQKAA